MVWWGCIYISINNYEFLRFCFIVRNCLIGTDVLGWNEVLYLKKWGRLVKKQHYLFTHFELIIHPKLKRTPCGRLLGYCAELETFTAHEFARKFQGYQPPYSWVQIEGFNKVNVARDRRATQLIKLLINWECLCSDSFSVRFLCDALSTHKI